MNQSTPKRTFLFAINYWTIAEIKISHPLNLKNDKQFDGALDKNLMSTFKGS